MNLIVFSGVRAGLIVCLQPSGDKAHTCVCVCMCAHIHTHSDQVIV